MEQTADQFHKLGDFLKVPRSQQEMSAQLAKDVGFVVRDTGNGYYEFGEMRKVVVSPPDTSGIPVNTAVADSLNYADNASSADVSCNFVAMAISEANDLDRPTGPAQRAEVKRYADRCKLRFQP